MEDMDRRKARRKETRAAYETRRGSRSRLSLSTKVHGMFRETMSSAGTDQNDSFLELLLQTYQEHSENCSTSSVRNTGDRRCPLVASTPVKTVTGQVDSGSDVPSLPSSVGSIHTTRSSSHNTEDSVASETNKFDISVSFVEKGDYIYPKEPIVDVENDSDFEDPEATLSLQIGEDCRGLEAVGPENDVLGEVTDGQGDMTSEFTRSGLHKKIGAEEGEEMELYIISKERLVDLATKAKSRCQRCGSSVQVAVRHANGSAAHVDWVCPDGHTTPSWCSQETINGSHIGDIKQASAILLSGNNFQKIKMMSQFMRLHCINKTTFYQLQKKYLCTCVEKYWEGVQRETLAKHSGTPVVLCGDGRNDSPGFCAQYLTYTLMEHDTKDVFNVHFVDKREVDMKSPVMEAKAFKESLHQLEEKGVHIQEIVTDAHTSIAKHMREKRPDITHSWDVWHGAKNLGKKLSKVSARAATRRLVFWIRHVVLHFWYCAKECGRDTRALKAKWHGLTHHVTNKHTWISGMGQSNTCDHGELENPDREEWLSPGDNAHKALVEVAYERKFINNMRYFSNFRHTGTLESLHNHILMYASKRYSFEYPAYRARNLLAVIDYMAHKDRPVTTDDQGKQKHVAVWSKHAKNYVARPVMVPKTYSYIPVLMRDILARRERDEMPLFAKTGLMPGDPRAIRPRLAPFPPPSIEEILGRRHTRLDGN
ncbi:uncharacterized protein LOC105446831 [Strongylocentrotus purpuratus]|uniref:Uncharacterized protein n=1 Tax=Strongylocentrotus purpuratus TaxID=7668 RepID=A0A7M7HN39_STRPU|nr:uncharacterized protein LOC105446831 [Strongylocentrotus purpuratus]